MLTIKTTDVKAIVAATFPNYKRREVYVSGEGYVHLGGLNWSGGSRTEYHACTIEGKPIPEKYNMNAPAPWANPFEGKKVEIPEGIVIVSGGYFCGKVSRLHIYCNPANMPKFITAA